VVGVQPEEHGVLRRQVVAKPLPDIGGPGLRVLFCGINPGRESARSGHHFAKPGNRFWPALHAAGITPRLLAPEEDGELPRYGAGLTNLVDRPSAGADELTGAELRAGLAALDRLVARWEPRLVAVLGATAWRTATGDRSAPIGLQPGDLAGRPVWLLPNPSGRTAGYRDADFARLFGEAWAFSRPSAATRRSARPA
jgi:TDG/mug DNA glycosylase family protein